MPGPDVGETQERKMMPDPFIIRLPDAYDSFREVRQIGQYLQPGSNHRIDAKFLDELLNLSDMIPFESPVRSVPFLKPSELDIGLMFRSRRRQRAAERQLQTPDGLRPRLVDRCQPD